MLAETFAEVEQDVRQSKPSDVRRISISSIDPPTLNPRRDFDETELARLADSIGEVGLLQPVIVRASGRRFELVAGERRFRAVQQLGWKAIDASVRELDDRTAAEVRLLENLDRASLNPMEESAAFRILIELGHSPESLAKLAGRTEHSVNLRLLLVSLPDDWQARVRKGEISAAAAEQIVPWANHPQILQAMAATAKQWPMSLVEWGRRLNEALFILSRSLDPKDPTGPRFSVDEHIGRLDVGTIHLGRGATVKRAFATGIWDSLQDDVDCPVHPNDDPPTPGSIDNGRKAERNNGGTNSNPAAATARAARPAPRYDDPVLPDAEAAETDFRRRMAAFAVIWYRQALSERIAAKPLSELRDLAEWLGFDPGESWKLTRPFLELFTGGRLEALAVELDVDIEHCADDRERIAVLLAARPKRVPQALAEASDVAPAAL